LNTSQVSYETKVKEDYYIVVSEAERSLLSQEKRSSDEEEKVDDSETNSNKKVLKIMLVEDEKILRKATKKVIEKYLKQVNRLFEITECIDGAECLYFLYNAFQEKCQYDLILTDLNMNFISGNMLIDTMHNLIDIKVLPPTIKVYLLTSQIDATVKESLSKYIFLQEILPKPLASSNVEKIFSSLYGLESDGMDK